VAKSVATKATTRKKPVKLTLRLLTPDPNNPEDAVMPTLVLIEGTQAALEWFGQTIVEHARQELDSGRQMWPNGPGKVWFNKQSKIGFYLHKLPCANGRKDEALRKR
jgi:hypothetical protein